MASSVSRRSVRDGKIITMYFVVRTYKRVKSQNVPRTHGSRPWKALAVQGEKTWEFDHEPTQWYWGKDEGEEKSAPTKWR
jgi:hypothetical protein